MTRFELVTFPLPRGCATPAPHGHDELRSAGVVKNALHNLRGEHFGYIENHKLIGSVQHFREKRHHILSGPGFKNKTASFETKEAVLVWVGLDLNQRSLRNGFTDRPL